MELQAKEILMLEDSLDALIAQHEKDIEEIKNLEDSYYKTRLDIVNRHGNKNLTVNDLKQKEIQKELNKIAEINKLKKKLFLSNSYLLLVSNRIKLCITDK